MNSLTVVSGLMSDKQQTPQLRLRIVRRSSQCGMTPVEACIAMGGLLVINATGGEVGRIGDVARKKGG
jgi:hypothetical protein